MPARQYQNYASSGEVNEQYIGGTEAKHRVMTPAQYPDLSLEPCYCSYKNSTPLTMTNVFQKVSAGWVELVPPVGITLVDGKFTTSKAGVFQMALERMYTNSDTSVSSPLSIQLEIRHNGVATYARSAYIAEAVPNRGDATLPVTSPFILHVEAGDYFEFFVRALEGTASPESTKLAFMQVSAMKINN